MYRRLITAPAILLSLCGAAQADADSLTDNLGPREIALGDSLRAEATGTSSTVLNPAGLALNRQLVFEGSFGYRDTDKANIGSMAACDSTTPVAGCFYYHYLNAEPGIGDMRLKRRFHEAGVTAARALSPQVVMGTKTHFFDYNSNVEGEEDQRGYSVDMGLIFQPSTSVRIAGVGYNLVGTDSPQYPRGVGTGLVLRPGAGKLGLSLDALWNLDRAEGEDTGRYGGGIEYLLAPTPVAAYAFRVGGVYDDLTNGGYASFGLGYSTPKMGLDIGGRKQVSGDGDELLIQAGLRIVAPTPR
ncbi:MAG: hypothetical protein GY811_28845 [Myxococcales bacterium]|nr:hypothetical protein [Myxococcales bacterium]